MWVVAAWCGVACVVFGCAGGKGSEVLVVRCVVFECAGGKGNEAWVVRCVVFDLVVPCVGGSHTNWSLECDMPQPRR